MRTLIGLVILLGFVAVVSLALALVLDWVFPKRSAIGKSAIAGLIAGALPAFPVYGLVLVLSGPTDPTVAIPRLIMAALLLALFVGFPTAFFLVRRRSEIRALRPEPEDFE